MKASAGDEPLDQILGLMPIGLLVADPSGRLTLCNEAAAHQLVGRGATPGALLSEVLPELGNRWQDRRSTRSEVVFISTPEGRRRPVACVMRWLAQGADQEPRCTLVLHDLSASYADFGEEQQSMLDALALMMVAATLHELANPLFGASAGVELLLGDPGLQGEQREAVEDVAHEIERVTEVADRLRRLGPPKKKTRTTRPLGSLVSEAIAYQGDLLGKRGVHADVRIGEGLPSIPADNTRVVQVLTLVVRDALQRAAEGAVLSVDATTLGREAMMEVSLCLHPPGPTAAPPHAPLPEPSPTQGEALPFALSLARAAALNLGGDLHLEHNGTGVRWIVRLPTMVNDAEASADRR